MSIVVDNMADHGLDGDAALQLAPMVPKTPRFWPELKTRKGLGALCPPAASLVDVDALDLAARECFGRIDDVFEGMAIIGIAGQRLGMEHELAAGALGLAVVISISLLCAQRDAARLRRGTRCHQLMIGVLAAIPFLV